MKALKISMYQSMAAFKKPNIDRVGETYPLPPFATIKGFLHAMLNADTLINFKIAIAGTSEGSVFDIQTYQKISESKGGRNVNKVNNGYLNKEAMEKTMLSDLNLEVYVKADGATLERLKIALEEPTRYPSLGRYEDLVLLKQVKFVNLRKVKDTWNGIPINIPCYVPLTVARSSGLHGIKYALKTTYEVKDNLRAWKTTEVIYVTNGRMKQEVYVDKTEPVFFLEA